VMLNGVIGLRNHETGGWIVAMVVRKLANRGRGEILAGVEVLSYRPVPVTMQPAGGPPAAALYLPGRDDNGRQDAVLMRATDFHAGDRFVLPVGVAKYHIRLNRVIRKGPDWITARFEIEKKA